MIMITDSCNSGVTCNTSTRVVDHLSSGMEDGLQSAELVINKQRSSKDDVAVVQPWKYKCHNQSCM